MCQWSSLSLIRTFSWIRDLYIRSTSFDLGSDVFTLEEGFIVRFIENEILGQNVILLTSVLPRPLAECDRDDQTKKEGVFVLLYRQLLDNGGRVAVCIEIVGLEGFG